MKIAAHQVMETSCTIQFAKLNTGMAIESIEEIIFTTTEVRGILTQRSTEPDGTEDEGLTLVVTERVRTVLIIPP